LPTASVSLAPCLARCVLGIGGLGLGGVCGTLCCNGVGSGLCRGDLGLGHVLPDACHGCCHLSGRGCLCVTHGLVEFPRRLIGFLLCGAGGGLGNGGSLGSRGYAAVESFHGLGVVIDAAHHQVHLGGGQQVAGILLSDIYFHLYVGLKFFNVQASTMPSGTGKPVCSASAKGSV
jgi:hypothetical protein